MAGTQIRRRNASPFRIKPCFGQRPKNGVQSVGSNGSDVLQHDVSRSHHANDSHEFVEQAAACAFLDAGLLAGGADVLAGEAANDNIS